MDRLLSEVDSLSDYKDEETAQFYTHLADFVLQEDDKNDLIEKLIPKVYLLYEKEILRKDFIYLSLLSTQNDHILEKFLDYDKSVFSLNIEEPSSLYDYFIYKKEHWICGIINNYSKFEKYEPLRYIYGKLELINFIRETNLEVVNVDFLLSLLEKINVEHLDEFWRFYVTEITRFIDVVQFCKPLLKEEASETELYTFASENSLLQTLSNYINLNDSKIWETVRKKLETSEAQLNVFIAFTILSTLIDLLICDNCKQKDCINFLFEDIQSKLFELKDRQLQVELLEAIFCLMFHRKGEAFTCKEKEVRFVLCLLKSTTEELRLKRIYEKHSNEYQRLVSLANQVTDSLWRLDLILSTNVTRKVERNLLNYMLASPESLIHVCLKERNFERARQVVEIFSLQESDLAQEVNFSETFLRLKGRLRAGEVDRRLNEFFEAHPEDQKFLNTFDFALTETKTWEESKLLLDLCQQHSNLDPNVYSRYLLFYKRLSDLAQHNQKSLPETLTDSSVPLDLESFKTKEDFYSRLAQLFDEFHTQVAKQEPGGFNKNHSSHKTLVKISELCHQYVSSEKESIRYLQRTFNYLKAFARILYIEQNSSDIVANRKNSSYFDLFKFNRSELTGKLLFERHLDPTEFEKYFGKLKLDFLYHIVGNCFPTINLHVQENVTLEELYHDNMLYTPSPSIIVYIQKRNWLLAFILSEMYKVEGVSIDISEVRLRTFFNYLKSTKIQNLKALFERNEIVAALQNSINAQQIKLYFREHIVEHDLVSIQSQTSNSSDNLETGEEIFEDTKSTNWKKLYDIVDSIPESQMKKKSDLVTSKDSVLVNLVQDVVDHEYYKNTILISNKELRLATIFNNFKKWPARIASDVIKIEVTRFANECGDSKLESLENWIQHVELNDKLKDVFDLKSWHKSYNFCQRHPGRALEKILLNMQLGHLLEFIKLYKPSEEILVRITTTYTMKLMDLNTPLTKIKELLDVLPTQHATDICRNLLTLLRNLGHLQFVADYLNSKIDDDKFVKNVQISLRVLTALTPLEQEQSFCLINDPLSILEVLLMNTKLDKLSATLEVIKGNSVISVEKADHLLRKYAEKSLDFRVITHQNPTTLKTPDSKLLQSLDSLSTDKSQFVMPEQVPTKEEWVPNDDVTECMCCHQVTFSMFNRRHHCRRCGRVICYSCSLNRALVPSYGDILVRVCVDCYNQTVGSADSDRSDHSTRSYFQEFWLLNDDPEHNKIIREEFSYEHAPSTSLCLSILKYHSRSEEYPKFLLEQCEVMLRLLQPNQEPTQEIDYLLVIKMLQSLATAAKIVSTENMLGSGAATADRILSQAELLSLLAEHGCLHLMPLVGTQNLYVDANVLRRLRDKLLQREQWNLALEVSTKAGLDNTGVFAAWGKSCLKAGSLLVAREKFHRCLDRHNQYETVSLLSRYSDLNRSLDTLTLPSRISSSSTLSGTDGKPTKNPPLLHEILQILETKTIRINSQVLEKAQRINISGSMSSLNQIPGQSDIALSVLNKLKNLKEISVGNLSLAVEQNKNSSRPSIDPIFYDECVYYLSKYGTHLSLLEFYVRHGDFDLALMYVLDNRLTPEIFIDLYLTCLREGTMMLLQEQISRIDSSLNVWKEYLKELCRHLEQQQLLNSLYQLQLYIGDYVRASITCIRFYKENVKSFTELANNSCHLYKAEEHLRQILEQEQWVEVTSVGRGNTSKDSFEEKMLANPDLVMKIDLKDVNRHINTVKRQIEIVTFLAQCESSGVSTRELLKQLVLLQDPNSPTDNLPTPTLFDSTSDKTDLAVLLIVSDPTVEEGFNLAAKVIDDFKLRPIKVHCLAGKQLARCGRFGGILQLANCIRVTGINDSAVSDMLDEMLAQAVGTLIKEDVGGARVEDLIKLIKDRATKISAYIEAKQLKTAYFLAVKYKRTADIRRIQREAELLNMPTIKALCQKVLQASPQSSTSHHSKDK